MNAHIDVAFAHPNVAELPEVVRQWAERCPSGMSSTMRVDDGRGDPDV
jgi:hypothetical protein